MKNKYFKLAAILLVLLMVVLVSSCGKGNNQKEITEVDDTLYLDEEIDTPKAVPEGYPDPETNEGKAFYAIFRNSGMDAATKPNEHNHADGWTAWGDSDEQKSKLPSTGGNYYLTSDITLTSTWWVPSCANGSATKLCLNGHIIRIDADTASSVMYLNTFSYIDIYDCSDADCYMKVVKGKAWEVLGVGIDKPAGNVIELEKYTLSTPDGTIVHTKGGCITGGTASGIRVDRDVYFSACYLSIHGGNIVGNTSAECGGGVNFGDSIGLLDGGNIVGNYAAKSGGGVALQGPYNCACEAPAFTMNGGTIIGNTCANYGAGIFNNHNFKTTINAGLIRANKCPQYGGGIYSSTRRGFYIYGGTSTIIELNEAQLGGGVYTNSNSEFVINDCIIQNNTAVNGGGLYAGKTGTINNCTIQNNKASGNRGGGGGIYFRSTANVTIKNITVTGNIANYGGAMDISNGAIVKVYGGNFTNNTAKKLGGGACVVKGGNLTLGGTACIKDNNLNGKTNNIYLPAESFISLGNGSQDNPALKEGASLGVTLEKWPGESEKIQFTSNGSAADAKYFIADNGYTVESVSTYLSISK